MSRESETAQKKDLGSPSAGNDKDRQADFAWLRRFSAYHSGWWVALDNGDLIALAPTLKALRAWLAEHYEGRPLLHRIPDDPPIPRWTRFLDWLGV